MDKVASQEHSATVLWNGNTLQACDPPPRDYILVVRIYLSTNLDDNDYIDLGKLKATKGNMNYDVPSDTDFDKYNKVLIWCEPFGVLFGSASLT